MERDRPERGPELERVIAAALEARLFEVHTAMVARIVSFDAATQKADCKPLVKRADLDEEDRRLLESLPPIPSVPVVVMSGGGYRGTFPIRADPTTGDTCLLVFAEGSLDRWLAGSGAEVDPEIDHLHAIVDAVAIVGLRPFGAPLVSYPSDHATLGSDAGEQIHLREQTITVGDEGGAQHMPLWDTFTADLALALPEIVAALGAIGFASTNTAALLAKLQLIPPANPYKSNIGRNA